MGGFGNAERGLSSAFGPIESGGLVEEVCEKIRRAVLAGHFRPGARLVEATVAKELGVSRAPVREAARMLAQQGVLRQEPRRGFFVASLTMADIADSFDLSQCLAAHAIGAFARTPDMEALAALRDFVTALASGNTASTGPALVDDELRFGALVCALSGNTKLAAAYDHASAMLRLLASEVAPAADSPELLARRFLPVFKAVVRGDTARATALMAGFFEDRRRAFLEAVADAGLDTAAGAEAPLEVGIDAA